MFCPGCGCTDLDCIGSSSAGRTTSYKCLGCGAVFRLAPRDDTADKRFTIKHYGCPEREDVFRDDVYNSAWDTVVDRQFFSDAYQNLARDYYGRAYSDLESEEMMDDPDAEYTQRCLDLDIPFVELAHVDEEGYIDGMDVGDEVFIPGTPLSIVRTKNSKHRKGRKWLRCST